VRDQAQPLAATATMHPDMGRRNGTVGQHHRRSTP